MRLFRAAAALLLALTPVAAFPALNVGAAAPDFSTVGAIGGERFNLNLREQLRQGPIVLYFFPRAFTEGCTLEAHAFSEAEAEFRQLGARVIGMSADDYETLRRFSIEACRSAFPVATASPQTIAAYDVRLRPDAPITNRTSYVIAPDGRIIYAYSDLDWRNHVRNTLEAVRAWKARQR
jgi:peroxiredoxin